jgi:diguanylate cyclase (GGDEF)-like protein
VDLQLPIALLWVQDYRQAQKLLRDKNIDVLLLSTDRDFPNRLALARQCDDETTDPALIIICHQNDCGLYQASIQADHFESLAIELLSAERLEKTLRSALNHKVERLRLLRMINHDPMTGVANRHALRQHLKLATALANRNEQLVALLMVGLDNFTQVNEQLGHDRGDELLIQAGQRLQNSIRETDMVARLAGDEFAIVASGLTEPEDAATLAQGLLEACHFEIFESSSPIIVSCSIGIALYPDDGLEYSLLMQHADSALLQAKRLKRGCFQFADSPLNQLTHQHRTLAAELSKAKPLQQLALYYQPIINRGSSGSVVAGAEALLRWRHPQHGLLNPDDFLALATEQGLVDDMERWVLEASCQTQHHWQQQGLPTIPVAINITMAQLQNPTVLAVISQLLEQQVFMPGQLTLEIAESDLLASDSSAYDALFEIQAQGVNITLDNFGRELSSAKKIAGLPLKGVKLDRTLIQQLGQSPEQQQAINALIGFSQSMGLEVTAQGVENQNVCDYLTAHHCSRQQGYWLAEPMDAVSFAGWYRHHTGDYSNHRLHSG